MEKIKNLKKKKVRISSFWISDYGDIKCEANLFIGNRQVANIIISESKENLELNVKNHSKKLTNQEIMTSFKAMIYCSFYDYLKLPKISKCSKLLKEIYDNVRSSESSMCHITDEDWNEDYKERYTDKDIEILKEEIKKYGLDEVIGINEDEYKIIGYGDLETRFNDNRNLSSLKHYERER